MVGLYGERSLLVVGTGARTESVVEALRGLAMVVCCEVEAVVPAVVESAPDLVVVCRGPVRVVTAALARNALTASVEVVALEAVEVAPRGGGHRFETQDAAAARGVARRLVATATERARMPAPSRVVAPALLADAERWLDERIARGEAAIRLEVLGGERLLRCLARRGSVTHVTVTHPDAVIHLDVEPGAIADTRAWTAWEGTVEGDHALAAMLALGRGRVHVARRGRAAGGVVGVPLEAALRGAARHVADAKRALDARREGDGHASARPQQLVGCGVDPAQTIPSKRDAGEPPSAESAPASFGSSVRTAAHAGADGMSHEPGPERERRPEHVEMHAGAEAAPHYAAPAEEPAPASGADSSLPVVRGESCAMDRSSAVKASRRRRVWVVAPTLLGVASVVLGLLFAPERQQSEQPAIDETFHSNAEPRRALESRPNSERISRLGNASGGPASSSLAMAPGGSDAPTRAETGASVAPVAAPRPTDAPNRARSEPHVAPEPGLPDACRGMTAMQRREQARRHVELGNVLRRVGEPEGARRRFLEALGCVSNEPRALAGLALVELEANRPVDAVRWARELVRLRPQVPAHLVLLGDALAAAGERDAAIDAWRRALRIAPRHEGARRRLGLTAPVRPDEASGRSPASDPADATSRP
ncbi:MAG: hypothetical protein NZ898_03055 [Myxococcota bacterium]|nr:hypothetical protein [Myxococcota bacterium]